MFVALILYDPDFTRSLEDKFNTLKIFRPFFFKRLQRKSRQKKDSGIRFIEAYWHAITSSLPEELSTDELKVMLGDVLYQIVLEIRALSRDSERFLSALSHQSRLPGLKILLLEWANAMPVFTIPPLTNEDFEGHSIGQPNIPELLEAIRKVNIVLPAIGDVRKVRKYLYSGSGQSDGSAADRVGERVASPVTESQKTATIIGLLISMALFSIVAIVSGLGHVSLPTNTNSG
jgi:hypothetical protein